MSGHTIVTIHDPYGEHKWIAVIKEIQTKDGKRLVGHATTEIDAIYDLLSQAKEKNQKEVTNV